MDVKFPLAVIAEANVGMFIIEDGLRL